MVSESVSTIEAVRGEQWRLPDAELHSNARNHDSGSYCWPMGKERQPGPHDEALRRLWCCRDCVGAAPPRDRRLPGSQADLDACLDPLQRRCVLPLPGSFHIRIGMEAVPALGVSAGCGWHELDR